MKTNTLAQAPVIIVGGGLSGLAAAALLARAGHTVTVFEKSGAPGGRARTKRHGEFYFNQGAHALYLGGPGEKLLRELGVRYDGTSPDVNRSLAIEGRKLHRLPTGVTALLRTSLLSLTAKGEFVRLYSSLKHMQLAHLQHVSVHDWLERQVQHQQVRQLMLALTRLTTYTNAPELVPADLMIAHLNAQVRYLDGGWQTLIDGLWRVAQEAGARMVTQARVVAVETVEDKLTVRLADGTVYPASAVLLATDPATASTLIADGTHPDVSHWAAQSVPARVSCFDVALRRMPKPEHLFALGIDRPLYYSVHSAWAHLAPEGGAMIHVMKYLQPDAPAEPEATRRELEEILDLLQPGWRAEVLEQFFLPNMLASNAIVQAKSGGLSGRPGPTVPGIRNLYVAGDWVGTEGQLADACFASARSAAAMIMQLATQQNTVSLAH